MLKLRADVEILSKQFVLVGEPVVLGSSGVGVALAAAGPRTGQESLDVGVLEQRQRGVGTGHAVEVAAGGLPVREEGAEVGAGEDIPLGAQDRVAAAGCGARFSGADGQHAEVEPGRAADQLGSGQDRQRTSILGQSDAPREEHLQVALGLAAAAPPHSELENAGALEEELALLREEQRKAGQVDDGFVDFGLGKVGVGRDLGGETRGQAEPGHLEAGVGNTGVPAGRGRIAAAAADAVRLDAELESGVNVLDAHEVAGLRHLQELEVAIPRAPQHALVGAAGEAQEVHAEGGEVFGGAEAGERDLDLGRPAGLGDARLGPPPLVPFDVDIAAFVGRERVVLGAQRIDREVIAVAMIVKCVEHDLEAVVVGKGVVAAALAGGDAAWRRGATDAEIERILTHDHAHLGRFARRLVDVRLLLDKVGDRLGLAPRRLVEHAVDGQRVRDPRRARRLGRDRWWRGLSRRRRGADRREDHERCGGPWPSTL